MDDPSVVYIRIVWYLIAPPARQAICFSEPFSDLPFVQNFRAIIDLSNSLVLSIDTQDYWLQYFDLIIQFTSPYLARRALDDPALLQALTLFSNHHHGQHCGHRVCRPPWGHLVQWKCFLSDDGFTALACLGLLLRFCYPEIRATMWPWLRNICPETMILSTRLRGPVPITSR